MSKYPALDALDALDVVLAETNGGVMFQRELTVQIQKATGGYVVDKSYFEAIDATPGDYRNERIVCAGLEEALVVARDIFACVVDAQLPPSMGAPVAGEGPKADLE